MMTRKHFEMVAETIKFQKEQSEMCHEQEAVFRLKLVADTLSYQFKADNSKFNRPKFMRACGFL